MASQCDEEFSRKERSFSSGGIEIHQQTQLTERPRQPDSEATPPVCPFVSGEELASPRFSTATRDGSPGYTKGQNGPSSIQSNIRFDATSDLSELHRKMEGIRLHVEEHFIWTQAIYKKLCRAENNAPTPFELRMKRRRPRGSKIIFQTLDSKDSSDVVPSKKKHVRMQGDSLCPHSGSDFSHVPAHVDTNNIISHHSSEDSSHLHLNHELGLPTCNPTSQAGSSQPMQNLEWLRASHGMESMHELTQFIQGRNNNMSQKLAKVWRFLEDKNSGRWALLFFYLRQVFLFFAVFLACLDLAELSSTAALIETNTSHLIQFGIEVVFTLELLVRFIASPRPNAFFRSFYNVIDLISTFPLLLRSWIIFVDDDAQQSEEVTSLLGIVPVFRVLKILRSFETFQLLLCSFQVAVDALPILLFALFLLVVTFAALIYYNEPRDVVPTIPIALYFVMVTLSTVGYGDISPTTLGGRVFTILLIVCGSLYMAVPIGIVGKAFSDVWEDRHRLLLLQQMRSCVECAGYSQEDLLVLLQVFDENGDGMLDYSEFRVLLQRMQVNVDERLVRMVFEGFDTDDGDCIDFHELVHGLFSNSAMRNDSLRYTKRSTYSSSPPKSPKERA